MNNIITDAYPNSLNGNGIIGPYHVETIPDDIYGSYVSDTYGYNVLAFKSKPGAKFTSKSNAELICNFWNKK